MLQQTQVSRVEGFYQRFLAQYPTLGSLASAPPVRVRESWQGLGYYRRAANLHRLAQEVMTERRGVIPSDPEELRRLPGVGRYTAAAVASFAFERAVAPVDTNVARVLRRAFHPRVRSKAITRRVWNSAELLMPPNGKSAWTFNQAMMELGALICTARIPRCDRCPVRKACATGRSRPVMPASPRRTVRPDQMSRRSMPRSADAHGARRSNGPTRPSDPGVQDGSR
jgi:A/G-specific adenine glycosylase